MQLCPSDANGIDLVATGSLDDRSNALNLDTHIQRKASDLDSRAGGLVAFESLAEKQTEKVSIPTIATGSFAQVKRKERRAFS